MKNAHRKNAIDIEEAALELSDSPDMLGDDDRAAHNADWIRGEVAFSAEQLKLRNLAHANEVAAPVHPNKTIYGTYVKRGIDVVLSGVALVILLPVNGVLAILTFRDVGSPILFHQERTGKDLKPFELVKFRNMTNEKDENGELLPPDQRITKFGAFVRNHSLDELLNFWSVFKGDMSLIGPRPLPIEFTGRMTERHKARYSVRPGLECPMMILVDPNVDYAHTRFENDIAYVENVSFTTDVVQALRLVKMVFHRAATNAYTGTDSHFIGYDREGHAMSLGRLKDVATYRREVLGEGD